MTDAGTPTHPDAPAFETHHPAMNATVAAATHTRSTPKSGRIVSTALAGAFFASLANQFTTAHLADIQGGLGVSADDASWITTIYTMTSFVGIVLSPVVVRAFGLRRYFAGAALMFAVTAWAAFASTTLPTMLIARAIQGIAGDRSARSPSWRSSSRLRWRVMRPSYIRPSLAGESP